MALIQRVHQAARRPGRRATEGRPLDGALDEVRVVQRRGWDRPEEDWRGWVQVAGEAEETIATSRAVEITGLDLGVNPNVSTLVNADKYLALRLLGDYGRGLSLRADGYGETTGEATRTFDVPALLLREVFPDGKDVWRGRWQDTVELVPYSGHRVETEGGWGKQRKVRKHDKNFVRDHVPTAQLSLKPQGLSVTRQVNKKVSFRMEFQPWTLNAEKAGTNWVSGKGRVPHAPKTELRISAEGSILLSGLPLGYLTEQRIVDLVRQWDAWARARVKEQIQTWVLTVAEFILRKADLDIVPNHLHGKVKSAEYHVEEAQKEVKERKKVLAEYQRKAGAIARWRDKTPPSEVWAVHQAKLRRKALAGTEW